MTVIDFNDDGCTVYILMLESVAHSCGIGIADGRAIQFLPSLKCAFEQIAEDARHNKQSLDANLDQYKIFYFTTKFTVSSDCGARSFNVVEVDHSIWHPHYKSWIGLVCSKNRSRKA